MAEASKKIDVAVVLSLTLEGAEYVRSLAGDLEVATPGAEVYHAPSGALGGQSKYVVTDTNGVLCGALLLHPRVA